MGNLNQRSERGVRELLEEGESHTFSPLEVRDHLQILQMNHCVWKAVYQLGFTQEIFLQAASRKTWLMVGLRNMRQGGRHAWEILPLPRTKQTISLGYR